MNYFPFHIGDWLKKTGTLKNAARGIYITLLCHYYATERPLPADIRELERLTGCTGKALPDLHAVLEKFFVLGENGYTNPRADEELAKMREVEELETVTQIRRLQRVRKSRETKAQLIEELRAGGVDVDDRFRMSALKLKHAQMLANAARGNSFNGVSESVSETIAERLDGVSSLARSPVTNNHSVSASAETARETETVAIGAASKAMRQAGLAVAPGDPRLIALVRRGAGLESFAAVAAEAAARGKAGAWALATLKGRLDDAETRPASGSRRRDHAVEVAEWAPLAAIQPNPNGPPSLGMAPPSHDLGVAGGVVAKTEKTPQIAFKRAGDANG